MTRDRNNNTTPQPQQDETMTTRIETGLGAKVHLALESASVASNTGPETVELRNTNSLVADCVQESTENSASP